MAIAMTAAPAQAGSPPAPVSVAFSQELPAEVLRVDPAMSLAAAEASDVARGRAAAEAFKAAAEAIAAHPGIGTCFRDFLAGHPRRAAVERSVVTLVAKDSAGFPISTGAGFVVRNSADETGHNRIVTGRHLANPADLDPLETKLEKLKYQSSRETGVRDPRRLLVDVFSRLVDPRWRSQASSLADDAMHPIDGLPDQQRERLRAATGATRFDHIDAYASDGAYIGRLDVVAMGQPDGKRTRMNRDGAVWQLISEPDDWAVGRMDTRGMSQAEVARLDAIPGIDLSPLQSPAKTVGVSGDGRSPAAGHGYSGGPVFDSAGRVHGIASAMIDVGVQYEKVGGMAGVGGETPGITRGTARMALRAPLVVNPLGDPRLLQALGRAGRGIRVSGDAPLYTETVTTIRSRHVSPSFMPLNMDARPRPEHLLDHATKRG